MLSGRVTTSMVQRNVLSDLNSLSSRLAATQSKAASGKQITRPSDDPFNTARAMGLRANLDASAQYQRTIDSAKGFQDATEASLAGIGDYVSRAHDLIVQGASGTADPAAKNAIADEIDQIISGVKETANAKFGDGYILSGNASNTPPYTDGPDDTYKGDQGGLDPAVPGQLREIGPGVTLSINTVGQEILGDGQGSGDGKLLETLRNVSAHLRANDSPALSSDLTSIDANLDTLLAARSRNGAKTNRLDAASTRLDQIQETTTKQLSDTEDADLPKTLIDFNSQSVAYQAALKAGANIVQTSLMDFLH
jgi:flagellar hook-associated protein 3 FlgL